jgi:hypothetical protein
VEGPAPAREAACILGVSARHVARRATRGELVYEETPLGRLYDRAALERRRVQPPRRGRPPTRRPAPEPAGPKQEDTFIIVMEEKETLVDERGQPGSVLARGARTV